MINYLGFEFNSRDELTAWSKSQHITAYAKYAAMFANNPTTELSVMLSKHADALHNIFGMTWDEIEEIEINAIQTA